MLGKENTGEQVADNQSRLIRMQKEDAPLSSNQQILQLPEGFTIGKAIGGGDCFFHAVAQGLKQLKPEMNFTVKSLREVCRKQALSSQEMKKKIIADARNRGDSKVVLPEPGIDNDELWKTYLIYIEYSIEDIEKMQRDNKDVFSSLTGLKYGSTLQIPIWGRPEIEGRMICNEYNEYNVKLHVIEDLSMSGCLIDGLASKPVSTDYNDKDTIHIINKGGAHFEPILRKQILPHSDLTQIQSMLKELSLEQIYEELIDTIEDCSLLEMEKLEKLKVFFRAHPRLDVNFQVNQRGDTLLHIAVRNDELEIIRFLLRKKANANVLNMEGKTSIDIARSNNRKGIAKILQPLVSYKRIDVPGDGSCLFWSAALAYLTPVKFDNNEFCKRFYKLFGDGHDVQIIQRLIQGDVDIYQNDMLRRLVEKVFRERVVKKMRSFQEELKDEISAISVLQMLKDVKQLYEMIQTATENPVPITFDNDDKRSFETAKYCYLCSNLLIDDKVRDHCHFTGENRGATHSYCNLRFRVPTFIPVFFHNLSGYDCHLFIRELSTFPGKIKIIPINKENYISFTKYLPLEESKFIAVRFIDSFKFLGTSLEQLVKNLNQNNFMNLRHFCENENQFSFLQQKGIYPYDYMTSWNKYDETSLPPLECFFSKLTNENISQTNYEHASNVWVFR